MSCFYKLGFLKHWIISIWQNVFISWSFAACWL